MFNITTLDKQPTTSPSFFTLDEAERNLDEILRTVDIIAIEEILDAQIEIAKSKTEDLDALAVYDLVAALPATTTGTNTKPKDRKGFIARTMEIIKSLVNGLFELLKSIFDGNSRLMKALEEEKKTLENSKAKIGDTKEITIKVTKNRMRSNSPTLKSTTKLADEWMSVINDKIGDPTLIQATLSILDDMAGPRFFLGAKAERNEKVIKYAEGFLKYFDDLALPTGAIRWDSSWEKGKVVSTKWSPKNGDEIKIPVLEVSKLIDSTDSLIKLADKAIQLKTNKEVDTLRKKAQAVFALETVTDGLAQYARAVMTDPLEAMMLSSATTSIRLIFGSLMRSRIKMLTTCISFVAAELKIIKAQRAALVE